MIHLIFYKWDYVHVEMFQYKLKDQSQVNSHLINHDTYLNDTYLPNWHPDLDVFYTELPHFMTSCNSIVWTHGESVLSKCILQSESMPGHE